MASTYMVVVDKENRIVIIHPLDGNYETNMMVTSESFNYELGPHLEALREIDEIMDKLYDLIDETELREIKGRAFIEIAYLLKCIEKLSDTDFVVLPNFEESIRALVLAGEFLKYGDRELIIVDEERVSKIRRGIDKWIKDIFPDGSYVVIDI